MSDREKKLMEAKAAIAREMSRICDQHGLSAVEALALCAYMTGSAIAMQDQRTMTSAKAMQIVSLNLQAGNKAAMEQVLSAGGRAN